MKRYLLVTLLIGLMLVAGCVQKQTVEEKAAPEDEPKMSSNVNGAATTEVTEDEEVTAEEETTEVTMKSYEGMIEIFPEFSEGLKHIEKFRYLTLVYHLHQSKKYNLKIKRDSEEQERGVFSTRSPNRPNSIGISVVRLVRVENTKIYIKDLDILDGTPLLDIKPFKDIS